MELRETAVKDMVLLVATGGLHLLFENVLHAKGPFLAAVGVVWLMWIVRRWRQEPGLAAAWGLGGEGLGPATLAAGAATLPAAAGLLWLGARLGHGAPDHLAALVGLYLPWALVQQVALNGILLRGLERLAPPAAAGAGAAVLFATAHLPDLRLAALTLAGGLLWTALYRRRRTVWPLAASHAILGALAYTCVLGRDPLREALRLVAG